jgi:hypothetical protein
MALVGVIALLGACGGLTPAGSNGAGGNSGGGASNNAAGDASLSAPCSLLTEAEVAGGSHLLDTDLPLAITPQTGDPAYCEYTFSDKTPILKFAIRQNGAADAYQKALDPATDQAVADMGDKAQYAGDGVLKFLTGPYFVNLDAHYAGEYYTHGDYYQTGVDLDKTVLLAKIIESRLRTGSVPAALEITAPPALQAHAGCDLLSADEAAGIVGKGAMTTSVNESVPNYCYYSIASSSEPSFNIYFKPYDGQKFFASEQETVQAQPVSGIGDKAMYDSFSQKLHVLKGDSVIVVSIDDLSMSPDDAQDLAQQIAAKVLPNL